MKDREYSSREVGEFMKMLGFPKNLSRISQLKEIVTPTGRTLTYQRPNFKEAEAIVLLLFLVLSVKKLKIVNLKQFKDQLIEYVINNPEPCFCDYFATDYSQLFIYNSANKLVQIKDFKSKPTYYITFALGLMVGKIRKIMNIQN